MHLQRTLVCAFQNRTDKASRRSRFETFGRYITVFLHPKFSWNSSALIEYRRDRQGRQLCWLVSCHIRVMKWSPSSLARPRTEAELAARGSIELSAEALLCSHVEELLIIFLLCTMKESFDIMLRALQQMIPDRNRHVR